MLKHSLTTLKSGLTVIQVPMPAVASVTVLALVNAGSRYEAKEWWGISHILEHMVFKGTAKYEDAQSLAAAVDGVGANFNAFTSKEYTGYYVKAAAKHLTLALEVVSDMLLTPRLRKDDLEREKSVIIEELNMYADMPANRVAHSFDQLCFIDASLGHDIIGTKETITGMTPDFLQQYLKQWYGLKNIILILAGDDSVLGKPALLDQIDQTFSKGDASQRHAEKALDHLGAAPLLKGRLSIEKKKTEQAHFVLGFPGLKRTDPQRFALSLLATILGGNMSSRLFTEVREKRGLCYYVHSDLDFYHDAGIFGASAGVDPKRIQEAIEVTTNEFLAIISGKKPITAAELSKAKEYMAGKVVLDLEDSESVAQYFGMRLLLQNKIESPEALLAQYQAVTLEEVHQIGKKIIKPDQLRLAAIGPFTDKKWFGEFLKRL